MLPKNPCLRHVALAVHKLDGCEQFYNLLGMRTELKTPLKFKDVPLAVKHMKKNQATSRASFH